MEIGGKAAALLLGRGDRQVELLLRALRECQAGESSVKRRQTSSGSEPGEQEQRARTIDHGEHRDSRRDRDREGLQPPDDRERTRARGDEGQRGRRHQGHEPAEDHRPAGSVAVRLQEREYGQHGGGREMAAAPGWVGMSPRDEVGDEEAR